MLTSELLDAIRQRAYMPSVVAVGADDATLLNTINEELRSYLVPFIMRVREEYLLKDYDQTVAQDVLSYRIPKRAMGGVIRGAYRVAGGEEIPLNRLDISNTWDIGYRLIGPNVVLNTGTIAVGETLRLRIFVRPGKVVLNASAAKVIGFAGSTVTGDAVPAGWTNADNFDVIQGNQFHELRLEDVDASAVTPGAGGTVVFSAAPSVAPVVGDYIAKTGEAPFPMVPEDLHPLLAQRCAVVWLSQAGNVDDLGRASKILADMEFAITGLISSRTHGDKVITNFEGLVPYYRRYISNG